MNNQDSIKTKIFDTAKILFYENGFKDTFFSDIAKELGISKGLIPYHYESKACLGNLIYKTYIVDMYNTVSLKVYMEAGSNSYNPQIITSVTDLARFDLYRNDPKAARFMIEFLGQNMHYSINQDNISLLPNAWTPHQRFYSNKLLNDEESFLLFSSAVRGATNTLQVLYFSGKLDVPFEKFFEHYTLAKYMLAGLSVDEIEDTIDRVNKIYGSLDLAFLPYFKIK